MSGLPFVVETEDKVGEEGDEPIGDVSDSEAAVNVPGCSFPFLFSGFIGLCFGVLNLVEDVYFPIAFMAQFGLKFGHDGGLISRLEHDGFLLDGFLILLHAHDDGVEDVHQDVGAT